MGKFIVLGENKKVVSVGDSLTSIDNPNNLKVHEILLDIEVWKLDEYDIYATDDTLQFFNFIRKKTNNTDGPTLEERLDATEEAINLLLGL